MPRHHTTVHAATSGLIPCVAYYRCSSAQQELSLDQQRAEVIPYAERKGYKIIREYVDEGKSASKDTDKRTAFLKMIADSARQDFKAVVCYDASRFTRLDGIDGNLHKQILRTNGIVLDTVKEGEFDWRVPEGRWKDMAFCESNKAFSLNISKDSLRGRRAVLQMGYWPTGLVPYGYDRNYSDGVREQFVRRNEPYRKGRNWHLRLVVNDGEKAIVQEIFDRFVKTGISLRQLALDLTKRKIPNPAQNTGRSQGYWDKDSLRGILTNRAYLGIGSLGHGRRVRTAHNRAELTEIPGACPAIVDPAIWSEAQALLDTRRREGRKPQYHQSATLSGFVVCGHCGYRMKKAVYKKSNRVYFTCEHAIKHPGNGCHQWRVYEDELLPEVKAWLYREIDAELMALTQSKPADADGRTAEETILAASVVDLSAKVETGTQSALLAPPVAREKAWAQVAQWQDQLDQTRARLELIRALRNDPDLQGFSDWWGSVKDKLISVGPPVDPNAEELAQDDPGWEDAQSPGILMHRDQLRALLFKLGFSVKLWFRHEPDARKSNRTASEWIEDRREISVRASLDSGEHPLGADSIIAPQRIFAFSRAFSLGCVQATA